MLNVVTLLLYSRSYVDTCVVARESTRMLVSSNGMKISSCCTRAKPASLGRMRGLTVSNLRLFSLKNSSGDSDLLLLNTEGVTDCGYADA